MKMKVGDKEIGKKLQGHGKTNFKEQMYLILVLFIRMDTTTIYHSVASVYPLKMLQYLRKVGQLC